jgi:hypothetical protein
MFRICGIWGSHSGGHEELYLLGYNAVKPVDTRFTLVSSCLAYSSTLNIDATLSSETSVDYQRTTWHYIPEDRTLHF